MEALLSESLPSPVQAQLSLALAAVLVLSDSSSDPIEHQISTVLSSLSLSIVVKFLGSLPEAAKKITSLATGASADPLGRPAVVALVIDILHQLYLSAPTSDALFLIAGWIRHTPACVSLWTGHALVEQCLRDTARILASPDPGSGPEHIHEHFQSYVDVIVAISEASTSHIDTNHFDRVVQVFSSGLEAAADPLLLAEAIAESFSPVLRPLCASPLAQLTVDFLGQVLKIFEETREVERRRQLLMTMMPLYTELFLPRHTSAITHMAIQASQLTDLDDDVESFRQWLRDELRRLSQNPRPDLEGFVAALCSACVDALAAWRLGGIPDIEAESWLHGMSAVGKQVARSLEAPHLDIVRALLEHLTSSQVVACRLLCRLAVVITADVYLTLTHSQPFRLQVFVALTASVLHPEAGPSGSIEFRIKQDHIGIVSLAKVLPLIASTSVSLPQPLASIQAAERVLAYLRGSPTFPGLFALLVDCADCQLGSLAGVFYHAFLCHRRSDLVSFKSLIIMASALAYAAGDELLALLVRPLKSMVLARLLPLPSPIESSALVLDLSSETCPVDDSFEVLVEMMASVLRPAPASLGSTGLKLAVTTSADQRQIFFMFEEALTLLEAIVDSVLGPGRLLFGSRAFFVLIQLSSACLLDEMLVRLARLVSLSSPHLSLLPLSEDLMLALAAVAKLSLNLRARMEVVDEIAGVVVELTRRDSAESVASSMMFWTEVLELTDLTSTSHPSFACVGVDHLTVSLQALCVCAAALSDTERVWTRVAHFLDLIVGNVDPHSLDKQSCPPAPQAVTPRLLEYFHSVPEAARGVLFVAALGLTSRKCPSDLVDEFVRVFQKTFFALGADLSCHCLYLSVCTDELRRVKEFSSEEKSRLFVSDLRLLAMDGKWFNFKKKLKTLTKHRSK